jgi:hypothetical protein
MEYIVIGANHLGRMRTWVDAAYTVHPDMSSHTGGIISFGRGGIACKSSKQKLNTKSSGEAEFVGASNYLPNTIWVKMFMELQGYAIEENIFEQDNKSAIKLERNGRTSAAGPKSRHINIRYFWLKDRTKSKHIQIRHCPTINMLADFLPSLYKVFCLGVSGTSSWTIATPVLSVPLLRSSPRSVLEREHCDLTRASLTQQDMIALRWADVVKASVALGTETNRSSKIGEVS